VGSRATLKLPGSTGVGSVLLAVCLVAAGGCGGDSTDSSAPKSNGIESKPASQALEQTGAALRRVKSFHVEATQGRSTTLRADVAVPKKLRLDLEQSGTRSRMIYVDGALYIKGDRAFWERTGARSIAGRLAGRWFKTPGSANKGLQDLIEQLAPGTLGRCLLKDHGTITRGPAATVDGQRAIVLLDKGDRPGTAPGKLYVAATGDPLPLRTIATGPERRGGKKDPLCDGDTPTQRGDAALFSRYDERLDITAPPGAVGFPTAQSSS
jgi:hypothetical protein